MHLDKNDSTVFRVMGTSSAGRPTEIYTVIKNQVFQLSRHASAVGKLQIADSRLVCCKAERQCPDRRTSLHPFPKRNPVSLTDRRPRAWWSPRPHQNLLHWRRLFQLGTLAGLRRPCGSLPEPSQQQLLRRGLCHCHLRRHHLTSQGRQSRGLHRRAAAGYCRLVSWRISVLSRSHVGPTSFTSKLRSAT